LNATGIQQGYDQLYRLLQRQATVLAYIDTFWIMGVICLMATPQILLARIGHRSPEKKRHPFNAPLSLTDTFSWALEASVGIPNLRIIFG